MIDPGECQSIWGSLINVPGNAFCTLAGYPRYPYGPVVLQKPNPNDLDEPLKLFGFGVYAHPNNHGYPNVGVSLYNQRDWINYATNGELDHLFW